MKAEFLTSLHSGHEQRAERIVESVEKAVNIAKATLAKRGIGGAWTRIWVADKNILVLKSAGQFIVTGL